MLAERAGVAVQRRLRRAHDWVPRRSLRLSPPAKGESLGVRIDPQNTAAFSQTRGGMNRKRGPAHPSFLVQERDDSHGIQFRDAARHNWSG